MITIITGNLDSGKTTRLIRHYETFRKGDGFASLKVMQGKTIVGFDAKWLSTGKTRRFLTHQSQDPTMEDLPAIGPYHMNQETYLWVMVRLKAMINQKVSPIYLDEIGQLELNGKGYDIMIKAVIERGLDLVCVVRTSLVEQIIRHYHMIGVKILS